MCSEDIMVREVKEDEEKILSNLVSLYLHDLSEFADDLKIDQEGKFVYEGLHYYFTEKELHPYFIYSRNEIAGFLLLNSGKYVPEDTEYSIHEIFILKSFRGKGIASIAIKKLFEMYRGQYRVEQLKDNKLAINFWKRFYQKQNIDYQEEIEMMDGFEVYTQLFRV